MCEERTTITRERLVEAVLERIPILDDSEWLDCLRAEWPEPLTNTVLYLGFFAGRYLDFCYDRPAVAADMAARLAEIYAECDAAAKESLGVSLLEEIMLRQRVFHKMDPDYEQRTDEIEAMLPRPIRIWFTRWRGGSHYTINEYLMDGNGNGNGLD